MLLISLLLRKISWLLLILIKYPSLSFLVMVPIYFLPVVVVISILSFSILTGNSPELEINFLDFGLIFNEASNSFASFSYVKVC